VTGAAERAVHVRSCFEMGVGLEGRKGEAEEDWVILPPNMTMGAKEKKDEEGRLLSQIYLSL